MTYALLYTPVNEIQKKNEKNVVRMSSPWECHVTAVMRLSQPYFKLDLVSHLTSQFDPARMPLVSVIDKKQTKNIQPKLVDIFLTRPRCANGGLSSCFVYRPHNRASRSLWNAAHLPCYHHISVDLSRYIHHRQTHFRC